MKKIFATLATFVLIFSVGVANASTWINFQETETPTPTGFAIGDVSFTNWEINNDLGTPTNKILQATTFAPAQATITFSSAVNIEDIWISWFGGQVTTSKGDTFVLPVVNGNLSSNPALLGGLDLTGITSLTFDLFGATIIGGILAPSTVIVDNLIYTATPIPGAAWLLGSGLVGLVGLRRRFFK